MNHKRQKTRMIKYGNGPGGAKCPCCCMREKTTNTWRKHKETDVKKIAKQENQLNELQLEDYEIEDPYMKKVFDTLEFYEGVNNFEIP